MPWYLYLALKQLFPTGRRITFFTVVSILGVAAGVWLLVVTTGVMGGFGAKYGQMIIDTQGDAQIRGGLIDHPEKVQALVDKIPGVAATTPFAEGVVMIMYRNRPSYPGIQGVDINSVENVLPIRRYIIAGSLDNLDDDTIILSSGLAQAMGARLGSKVQIVTPLTLEKLNNDEVLLPTELTVVGIFEIGHQQLDKSVAVVTLRRMQDLYGLGSYVHGINVKISPGQDVSKVVLRINDALPPDSQFTARTWMEANDAFLFALRTEKILVQLMISFVVLIAMFLVTAMLLIAVVRKTREIGLIGALGGRPHLTALCFCFQGFVVGLLGAVLGVTAGFLTLQNIDHIARFIAWITGSWDTLVAIYQFTAVPAHITTSEVIGISIYAVGMATLAGLIAAWRAARLKPVEAMRNE